MYILSGGQDGRGLGLTTSYGPVPLRPCGEKLWGAGRLVVNTNSSRLPGLERERGLLQVRAAASSMQGWLMVYNFEAWALPVFPANPSTHPYGIQNHDDDEPYYCVLFFGCTQPLHGPNPGPKHKK